MKITMRGVIDKSFSLEIVEVRFDAFRMYSIAVILVRNKYNSSIIATVLPLSSNSFVIYERTLKSIASLSLRLVSIKPLTPKQRKVSSIIFV